MAISKTKSPKKQKPLPSSYIIRIPRDTYLRLLQLQQEITASSGRRPSLGEVVAQILSQSHA